MTQTTHAAANLLDRFGRVGVWSGELRAGDDGAVREAAAEIEDLGFGALWFPGGFGGAILAEADRLLGATRRLTVATGIINIWKHEPAELGTWWRGLAPETKARVMLGLGVSHGPAIGEAYSRPLAKMAAYLDALDQEQVPSSHRCLAALGPKMLDLARERTAGSHPYLVIPEHTRAARERLGEGPLLAVEQGVIMEEDPAKAREIGRAALKIYMGLPNYVNNWRRVGFSEEDVTAPSDKLIDALFAWGGVDKIADRVSQHIAAGADHVCVQVVFGARPTSDLGPLRAACRKLAPALI
jgi:probable F420-dependent oxidoreductase